MDVAQLCKDELLRPLAASDWVEHAAVTIRAVLESAAGTTGPPGTSSNATLLKVLLTLSVMHDEGRMGLPTELLEPLRGLKCVPTDRGPSLPREAILAPPRGIEIPLVAMAVASALAVERAAGTHLG